MIWTWRLNGMDLTVSNVRTCSGALLRLTRPCRVIGVIPPVTARVRPSYSGEGILSNTTRGRSSQIYVPKYGIKKQCISSPRNECAQWCAPFSKTYLSYVTFIKKYTLNARRTVEVVCEIVMTALVCFRRHLGNEPNEPPIWPAHLICPHLTVSGLAQRSLDVLKTPGAT